MRSDASKLYLPTIPKALEGALSAFLTDRYGPVSLFVHWNGWGNVEFGSGDLARRALARSPFRFREERGREVTVSAKPYSSALRSSALGRGRP